MVRDRRPKKQSYDNLYATIWPRFVPKSGKNTEYFNGPHTPNVHITQSDTMIYYPTLLSPQVREKDDSYV